MEPVRPPTSLRRVLTVLGAAAALVAAAAAPAQAHGSGSSGSPSRIASGLDNPRQLAFGPGGTRLRRGGRHRWRRTVHPQARRATRCASARPAP